MDLETKLARERFLKAEAMEIAMRAEAQKDTARAENARLHEEVEEERQRVRLLREENGALLEQLIERGHDLAQLRGQMARVSFFGRLAAAVGL